MHQQLSLHASVPNSDLKITLHTLAALSGMHPREVSKHCLVWKPTNPFKPVLKAGEVNQIEQYRITLINDDGGSVISYGNDSNNDELRTKLWSMQINEMPEAGKRKVTSQSQLNAKISEGDPFTFMKNLGYSFDYQYWTRGYRFVFGSIVLNLFRIYNEKKAEEVIDVDSGSSETQKSPQTLKLLDPSARWMVKAHIDVQQLTDMDAMTSATHQLERLQVDLAGLFELAMPNRVALDTRIRR